MKKWSDLGPGGAVGEMGAMRVVILCDEAGRDRYMEPSQIERLRAVAGGDCELILTVDGPPRTGDGG